MIFACSLATVMRLDSDLEKPWTLSGLCRQGLDHISKAVTV